MLGLATSESESMRKPWRTRRWNPRKPGRVLRKTIKPEFYSFPEKKPTREQLEAFWKDYDAKKRVRKAIISDYGRRKVMAVTPTILGIVRCFANAERADRYVNRTKIAVESIKKAKPKKFEMHPIQILDIRERLVLERVYLAPNAYNVIYFRESYIGKDNRYFGSLMQRMEKKGVSFEELKKATEEAYIELWKMPIHKQLVIDNHPTNLLALDYNPKTKKVLFGLIGVSE